MSKIRNNIDSSTKRAVPYWNSPSPFFKVVYSYLILMQILVMAGFCQIEWRTPGRMRC